MLRSPKYIALLITTLSSFLAPFMSASINIALPALSQEFAIQPSLLSWIAASFLLATAAFQIPIGKIGDIYGRKKLFTLGVLLYMLSALSCMLAPSAHWLISFRVIQGIGAAMIFGTSVAILTAVFPLEERGKALGINIAATYSGLSMGPVLGGILTQQFGWRSIFLFNALVGAIVLAGILGLLKGEWAEARGERFDWIGALLSCGMIVAVISGLSRISDRLGVQLLVIGLILSALFIWWELRVEQPVLNMDLFLRNRVFAFSGLAALLNYSATFAIGFLMSLYLQQLKGFSPQQTGLILVTQPVMQMLFSPIAGRLSDQIAPRILSSSGMSSIVIGLSLLALLQANTPLWSIIGMLMLVGLGFAFFSSPNMNAIMSSVDKRSYGVASATLAAMRTTGQALSMGIVTFILTLYLGNVQMTPATRMLFLTSMKIAFIVFAALCAGGVAASLARGHGERT